MKEIINKDGTEIKMGLAADMNENILSYYMPGYFSPSPMLKFRRMY